MLRLRIPAFMVSDADPHGIAIFLTYKVGSRSLASQNHELAVPALRWLGIHPSDFQRCEVECLDAVKGRAVTKQLFSHTTTTTTAGRFHAKHLFP